MQLETSEPEPQQVFYRGAPPRVSLSSDYVVRVESRQGTNQYRRSRLTAEQLAQTKTALADLVAKDDIRGYEIASVSDLPAAGLESWIASWKSAAQEGLFVEPTPAAGAGPYPLCWNCHKREQELMPLAPFCSTTCENEYNRT